MNIINKLKISGKYVFPIIEGGKGIGVSTGETAGAFAAAGTVGTFSAVFPQMLDSNGEIIPLVFKGKTRKERFNEIINFNIKGSLSQARVAHEIANGHGRIHMNILWGMAGAEQILNEVLSSAKGIIHGITAGAGMPYRLANIAQKYNTYYYPIVSSSRAFRALWLRSFKNASDLLGGVVYEDPWKAGGHTGITSKENPDIHEEPYERVLEIRKFMDKVGLHDTPIIMAGGLWYLDRFKNWINNSELGPIAFQFGTRPMLAKESPISQGWKEKFLNLLPKDVVLNKFSPTGFYSSAVNNSFLKELKNRSTRQISFNNELANNLNHEFTISNSQKVFINKIDIDTIEQWIKEGFTKAIRTPDNTLLFVTPEKANSIKQDQKNCKGCLAGCRFSSWCANPNINYTTGELPDPRSYCIQNTLQNIIQDDDINNQLMFSGANVFKFAKDKLFTGNSFPSMKELVDKIVIGK
jgi:nitronate monooxygenase